MSDEPADEARETDDGADGPEKPRPSLFSLALWGPDGPPERLFGRSDWGSGPCPEDDAHDDEECIGHVSRIKEPMAIPPPDLRISLEEMRDIAKGYRPVDMSDKWLAFMEDDRLFLHRSWTGNGIYEARFAAKKDAPLAGSAPTFVVTSARVESDPRCYNPETMDIFKERDFLRDLIIHVSGEPMPISLPVVHSGPTIEAVLGDITAEEVDAIVNPANTRLSIGGGLNGAIHKAAGPDLLAYCKTLDGCPVGRAKVTPGFWLDARWVIHTATPKWRGGTRGEPVLLESCYRESLARADEVGAQSIAFPALATGAHGYPLKEAAKIAVNMVRWTPTDVQTIRFVCFNNRTLRAFQSALSQEG